MERAALSAERRALGHDQQLSGRVRVTTPEMLGRSFVLPALQRVHERHPNIALELITTMARLDVTRREADIAVRTARPSEEGLIARRLGRMAMTAYVRKAKKRKEPEPLEAVAYSDGFKLPLRAAEDRVPGGRVSLRVNSITAAAEAVRLGWGAGDLPCWVGDADPELERAFPAERPVLLDVWLVLHRDVQRTTRVRAVIDGISEHFEACATVLAAGEP
jgi:DNA-binding transcriptional LysR family regulator